MDNVIIFLILGSIIEYLADGVNKPDEPTTLMYDPICTKMKLKYSSSNKENLRLEKKSFQGKLSALDH